LKGENNLKKTPEFWTSISGTSKYEISNYGNFRRILKTGKAKQIKPYIVKNKWLAVKVEYKNKYKEFFVHKLMAEVFLEQGELGQVVWHKNGLIRDNYAGNLEWITREELGKRTGVKTSRTIAVIQIDPKTNEVINFYKSISAAARDNYIHKETICQAIRGKLKTAAGYKWIRESY
jgi:hypothetical protein